MCCAAEDSIGNQMVAPTCAPTVAALAAPELLSSRASCSGPGTLVIEAEVDRAADVAVVLVAGGANITEATPTALFNVTLNAIGTVAVLHRRLVSAAAIGYPATAAFCGVAVADGALAVLTAACPPGSATACSEVDRASVDLAALCDAPQPSGGCDAALMLQHLQPQLVVTNGPGLLADAPALASAGNSMRLSQARRRRFWLCHGSFGLLCFLQVRYVCCCRSRMVPQAARCRRSSFLAPRPQAAAQPSRSQRESRLSGCCMPGRRPLRRRRR